MMQSRGTAVAIGLVALLASEKDAGSEQRLTKGSYGSTISPDGRPLRRSAI
jgi:hypothetical protein